MALHEIEILISCLRMGHGTAPMKSAIGFNFKDGHTHRTTFAQRIGVIKLASGATSGERFKGDATCLRNCAHWNCISTRHDSHVT